MDAASRRLIVPFLRTIVADGAPYAREAANLLERFGMRKRAPKATIRRIKPSQKDAMAIIRDAVLKRADGICECGCGGLFEMWGVEVDHFAGGSGRRRRMQGEATCWAITPACHRNRTRNWPSVEDWNLRFHDHCKKHGYPVLAHIIHEPLRRRGA